MARYYIVSKRKRLDSLKAGKSYVIYDSPPTGMEEYLNGPDRRYRLYVYQVEVENGEIEKRGREWRVVRDIPSSKIESDDFFLPQAPDQL